MTPTDAHALAAAPPPPPAGPAVDLMTEPTFEECLAEWNRYHADQSAGRLSFRGIPEGHHVAYYNGRIVGHDADSFALQHRAATALRVHWARVVVSYPWMW